MGPGEAGAAGALATDVVAAGSVLALAQAGAVLPEECGWAAYRNGVAVRVLRLNS